MRDAFGNEIDPIVGYARGRILDDERAFRAKVRRAGQLVAERAARGARFHILTGNRAEFPLEPADLGLLTDGWVGPALFEDELAERARAHVGAGQQQSVEVFNRTSAAVLATLSALVEPGDTIVSLVPSGRAHPCVRRGARFAGARVVEGPSLHEVEAELAGEEPTLAVITPVTSELDAYENEALLRVAQACHQRGVPTLVDDAYGARVRPVLLDGPRTFDLPVDLAVTNGDKAALCGPRSGLLIGETDLLEQVAARGHELALEGREPIRLALLRALQRYRPETLRADAEAGRVLAAALGDQLGAGRVRATLLGPTISEEAVLGLLLERAGLPAERCRVAPVEAVAAVCMLLLADYGIVTVNALSLSGARPSLRLKPTGDALEALGGPERFAAAVGAALEQVAAMLHDERAIAATIVG